MDVFKDVKKSLSAGKNINIIFIGDSITSAEWVHPNWRDIIEYVLKEELTKSLGSENWKIPSWGIRCFNYGFDGSTTTDILDMMNSRILSLDPDIAIYLINTNDMHIGIKKEDFKDQVQQIIDRLSTKCSHIILANRLPGNDSKYNEEYKKLDVINSIKSKKVTFVNMYEAFSRYDLDKFFTFKCSGNQLLGIPPGGIDFVHPNQLGNAYIAKIILEKGFGISFDPELFIESTSRGEMYPRY